MKEAAAGEDLPLSNDRVILFDTCQTHSPVEASGLRLAEAVENRTAGRVETDLQVAWI